MMQNFNYTQIPVAKPVSSEVSRMGRQVSNKPESQPKPKPTKPVQKISVRLRTF